MHRLVVGRDQQVTSDPFVAPDGETPAAPGAVTVTVTNAAGVALAAPAAADDGTGTGRQVATLTAAAHLTQPDVLTLVWTKAGQTQTDTVEVASGRYLEVYDVRQMQGVSSPGEFPTWRVLKAITEFEDLADDYRGIAHVRRVVVDRVNVEPGRTSLAFHRVLVHSVALYDSASVALPAASWFLNGRGYVELDSAAAGITTSPPGAGYDVKVVWEHGQDSGVPEVLNRAGRLHVRSTLLLEQSGLSRDVVATADQGFVTRMSTPDIERGRPTGFLEVDRLLNQIRDRRGEGIA